MISRNHVQNFKNTKAIEYTRKVNMVMADALSEINQLELSPRITDTLKMPYWMNICPVRKRYLRFYPINENEKREIVRQIIAYKNLPFFPNIIKKKSFNYDDYILTFVANKDLIKKLKEKDDYLYSSFDTIYAHLAEMPIIENYEHKPDTIYRVIKKHLTMNNIDTNFEYCIYIPAFNKFVLSNENNNILDLITKGDLYNFEIDSKNLGLFAFFLIRFLDKPSYLSFGDNLTIIFTWGIVLFIYLLFIYLLYTDVRISEVSELRNEFVNNITHEFKTPIATIALATEGLMDKDVMANKEAQENYIRIIQTENKRLENMVSSILKSTLNSEKSLLLQQVKHSVDVHYCIDPAIKEVLMLLQEKNGTISVNYMAKNAISCIDGGQIIQVFKNILENAIKYVLDGPPRIEIQTENKGKYIVISIKDNGIGMTQSQQKKIFNKLYRVQFGNIHNVTGFGLGLYIAKAIIKSHHGKITVESELNKGSTFRIYLSISNN
jgi:two-component system phosphate regulon sensor histidine kinase PhoR